MNSNETGCCKEQCCKHDCGVVPHAQSAEEAENLH